MAFPDAELGISVLAYLGADPTEDSSAWPTPVDLSARLMRDTITVTQGRRPGQDTLSSGSCTFELINTAIGDGIGANAAGVLTPDNPLSPYYGIWDLGAPVAIDVDGVGASPPYGLVRGYIAALEPRIVPGFGVDWSTVKVTLGGVVRRLGRGLVTRSALRWWADGQTATPVAWWPLEDRSEATSAASGLVGGRPLAFMPIADGTVTPDETGPVGAIAAIELSGGDVNGGLTRLSGEKAFTFTGSSGEMVLDYWFSADLAGGPSGTDAADLVGQIILSDGASGGGLVQISMTVAPGLDIFVGFITVRVAGQSSDSWDAIPLGVNVADGGFHHVRWVMVNNGADLDLELLVDGTSVGTTTLTTSGVPAVDSLTAYAGRWIDTDPNPDTYTFGMPVTWSHIMVWDDASVASPYSAGRGYAGEQAHERIARVCAEQRIPFTSAAMESLTCGPQPFADVPTILRDAEKVDRGILTELTSDWGLGYVSSAERANRIATMVISLSSYRTSEGTAPGVFTPVRDDSRLRNEWTINRPDGGYGTAKDEANQKKRGRYDDSDEVNVETDDMLANQASWRLREDSYDGWRYRTMPIDLAANASAALIDLLAAWLGTSIGDRIDRVSPPSGYAEEHLQLLGYTQRIGRKSWWVDLVVEPETPWEVNVYTEDDPLDDQPTAIPGRWAEDPNCAIRSALTTSTTSVPFDPNTFRWTTSAVTPDDFPFSARLVSSPAAPTSGGELVTVTALSTTAATYVAIGTAAHASNAAVSPGNYSGGAADDWVMVVARARNSTATLAISDANYTYTELAHQGGLYVWAAVRTSTAPAPTITPSGGAANMTVSGQVFGLRNMPITRPLTEYLLVSPALLGQTNASAQNIAYAGTEAGHIPGRVVLLIAGKSDDWTSAAQSVFTEVSEATTTTGDDQSLYIGYLIQTTPTLVSPGSITVTGGSSAVSDSVLLVLAGGYQTATVTRKANGVEKAHDAGTGLQVENALIWAL